MRLRVYDGETQEIFLSHHVSQADPDRFERHCHGSFELLYVVRGRGRYMVEGSEYPMAPHTLLLFRPYEYHYVCPERDCTYERYVINFYPRAFSGCEALLGSLGGGTGAGIYFGAESLPEAVRSPFEGLLEIPSFLEEERVDTESRSALMARAALTQILLLLSAAHPVQAGDEAQTLMTDVLGYINGSLQEPLTLDALSHRFFVSKYHLCRAFRQYTGTTFLSYLTTKRIAAAQQLIEEGEPATAVAYRVGFRDYSAFYRAYRKQTGHAPARRRK